MAKWLNQKKYSVPGWVLVTGMVVYCEWMLCLWTEGERGVGRMAVITLFALGLGTVLSALTGLLSGTRAGKAAAVAVSAAVGVVCLLEYFVSDAYQVFMAPATILGGAGGVAKDYLSIVLSLLGRNMWRVGLILLPPLAYALVCSCPRFSWKGQTCLVLAGAALYGAGFFSAVRFTPDGDKFGPSYSFDSAVRCFGLNMGLGLELTHGGGSAASFVQAPVPVMPPEKTTEQPVHTPEETTAQTEAAIDYGRNEFAQLDFAALAEQEKMASIASVHRYIASQQPSSKNAFTGLFQGKNLILITAESLTREVIDPVLTPTLYRLANQGIRFTDYYQPTWGASTTSGEFSNLTGIVPVNYGSCMMSLKGQDFFLMMGKQLSRLGYSGEAYHNHEGSFYNRNVTHMHLGYDDFLAPYSGMEGIDGVWPESDLQMIESTMPRYMDKQPFSVYYMTVSGHCMYSYNENAMSRKNYDKVKDLSCSEAVKCYLAANLELENAVTALVQQLEEKGIADDTVIVISPDHYPYALERSGTWDNSENYLEELFGRPYDKLYRDHNALIIWSGCLEGKNLQVDAPVYSLDILPTLSNLFGVEFDSRLLVGRDVFSDAPALVLWPDYSWKTELGTYYAQEKTFTPEPGAQVPAGYVESVCAMVSNRISFSRSVVEGKYYSYVQAALEAAR